VSLVELAIDDLRCIERAELQLDPGHNLIWGGNGSGKTSLLEAIFLLGRGRSFRTRSSERLIRYGRERLVVFGRTGGAAAADSFEGANSGSGAVEPSEGSRGVRGDLGLSGDLGSTADALGAVSVETMATLGSDLGDASGPRGGQWSQSRPDRNAGRDGGGSVRAGYPGAIQSGELGFAGRGLLGQALGVQVSRSDGTTARISGSNTKSLTELTQAFPVQVIDPGVHKLLEEGGHRRRRWMDWAVFHVEHQFGDWWLRYTRALKQRNAALRTHPAQAGVWDSELIRLGELIAAARGRLMEELLPYWKESVLALSGLEPELHYFKGWAQDCSLAEALAASKARDETKRITHSGPHRADVIVRMKGRPAREVLSRGQQKLVAVAMTLAQLHLLQSATQTTSTLLLDDPAAELDGEHLRRFIDQVLRLKSQLVLTSLHPEFHLFGRPNRVFHVEHGRVKPA